MSDNRYIDSLIEGLRIAEERRVLRALVVELLPADLFDDLVSFVEGRRRDIETSFEDFGGLQDLLNHLKERKKL